MLRQIHDELAGTIWVDTAQIVCDEYEASVEKMIALAVKAKVSKISEIKSEVKDE